MTTKDYLNQISRLNRMINNKLIELAQLKELACSISSITNEERVMTTPNFDRIARSRQRLMKWKERLMHWLMIISLKEIRLSVR